MKLSDRAIDLFREAVASRFGLLYEDDRRAFLTEILAKQSSRSPGADAESYAHRLMTGMASREEIAALAADLTVGETYFFRHPDQFRAFSEVVLLDRAIANRRRLHILSAGCSSGEEAYSLMMSIQQQLADLADWDVRVVGIDLNPAALARANRGRYTEWSLRGVADHIRHRYFHRTDKAYQLDDSVRALVSFEERNLLEESAEFWKREAFDAIFCRNVLMYFTPGAARSVVQRLTRSLIPGGHLFLGPAETLRGLSNDYHLRHTHETFYYQRRTVGEDSLPAPIEFRKEQIPLENLAPLLASADDSWVAAISTASERIDRLRREMKPVSPAEPQSRSALPENGGKSTGIAAARELFRQERFAEALEILAEPIRQSQADPDAQLLQAVLLINSGRIPDAERLCHEVLAGDEFNAEARYLLALSREHAREYASALEQDGIAIYLDPRFAMPHLHLGLLRKRTDDRDGASRAFRDAATLLPREEPSRIMLFGGGFSREMLIRLCEAELR
ncbi:MAG TPA: CheR family methyltransferase, partial [Urbifossiella sp.]